MEATEPAPWPLGAETCMGGGRAWWEGQPWVPWVPQALCPPGYTEKPRKASSTTDGPGPYCPHAALYCGCLTGSNEAGLGDDVRHTTAIPGMVVAPVNIIYAWHCNFARNNRIVKMWLLNIERSARNDPRGRSRANSGLIRGTVRGSWSSSTPVLVALRHVHVHAQVADGSSWILLVEFSWLRAVIFAGTGLGAGRNPKWHARPRRPWRVVVGSAVVVAAAAHGLF